MIQGQKRSVMSVCMTETEEHKSDRQTNKIRAAALAKGVVRLWIRPKKTWLKCRGIYSAKYCSRVGGSNASTGVRGGGRS